MGLGRVAYASLALREGFRVCLFWRRRSGVERGVDVRTIQRVIVLRTSCVATLQDFCVMSMARFARMIRRNNAIRRALE